MTEIKKNFEDFYDTTEIDREINLAEEEDPNYVEFSEEDYLEWYKEQKRMADQEFIVFDSCKQRTFDDIVNKYSILVGLNGESYINATRIMFYSLISNQLKFNPFTMDNKKIDLRMPLLLQLKAGHGKKNYEYFIRRTIEGLNKQYQEPTSYHPEQFVGKIIVKEHKDENIYFPVFGTLAADYLVIDEAHALLTRKENEECLRYLRTALDPIGDNRIEKKQVNVPDEEKLQYCPNCTVLLLTQPITHINEDLLMRGSFRRFIILFIDTTLDERMKARRSAQFLVLKEDYHNKMWERWIEFNKRLLEYKDLKYVCQDFSKIDQYLDDLGINAASLGKEVLEYYNTSQFTIKQNIFKMAIIRAIVEHPGNGDTINININHINHAISDWQKIWIPQVYWVSQQMSIESMNPIGWNEEKHGIIYNIIQINKEISRVNLLSEYSKVSNINKKALDVYLTKILKDLLKWNKIALKYSGKSNSKTVICR